jgi:hypothetical protein
MVISRPMEITIYHGDTWFSQRSTYKFVFIKQTNFFFTFMWPRCIVTNCFIIKPTGSTNFTNLFWQETVHVSDSSSVHRQQFIHCTLSNGICHTDFEQDQDGTAVLSWSCSKAVYKPVWHIPLLSVRWINSWWWTDELSETCRFSCQNNLWN